MLERSYRTFVVRSVVSECESVKSFHLVPEDGGPLDPHHPGQHLPLRLSLPELSTPVSRFYTISNFGEDHYRLTVRRETMPPGEPGRPGPLASAFLHDHVRVNDRLLARAPGGSFWLDTEAPGPVALIAGGIGITPFMSMLEALDRRCSDREVFFFLAVRHGGHHVFRQQLREIAGRRRNLRMRVFYEHPRNQDMPGRDYQHIGKLSIAALREQLPTLQMPYFLCAPAPMMQGFRQALLEEGIAHEAIRTESFGGPRDAAPAPQPEPPPAPTAADHPMTITFARSQTTVPWTGEEQSVLQIADQHQIPINSGCQYGDCGTCMTRLLAGTVSYSYPPGARIDPGYCLPCTCRPLESIVLDA